MSTIHSYSYIVVRLTSKSAAGTLDFFSKTMEGMNVKDGFSLSRMQHKDNMNEIHFDVTFQVYLNRLSNRNHIEYAFQEHSKKTSLVSDGLLYKKKRQYIWSIVKSQTHSDNVSSIPVAFLLLFWF